jgi:hypothetical protein
MRPRTIEPFLHEVLSRHRKMAFVSGPRQVGKTTLAKAYGAARGSATYFNWDVLDDQKRFARTPYFFETTDRTGDDLVILDEIHKYARWKPYLKGAYDKYKDDFRFLVTGSGRLDLYSRGGDSLLGRYLRVPVFPFTLGELAGRFPRPAEFKEALAAAAASSGSRSDYDALFALGGFPEPLLKGEQEFANVWRRERRTLLIREDVRDATRIREISLVELLAHLLVERVGSPLSVNSLRGDLGVAFETVRDWIETLARFYFLFRVTPYSRSLARTLRKEAKVYLFDWSDVDDEAARFENLVAAHLLKAVRTWSAVGAGDFELHYLRDKEKREVDFLVTERRRPLCLVEAKLADPEPAPALLRFQEALDLPAVVQVVHAPGVNRKLRRNDRVQWVVSADRWLGTLP